MSHSAQKPRFRPETFGKFTLIAPIATGGMGELFLARMSADAGFERLVVIKRILPHLTDKPEFVNMFVDEARVAAQIHHPNVCQILEFGQIEGRYYMALEYLEGISMTQVIVGGREHDKLRSLRFLIAIMTQVCEGLHFAHNLRTPSGALAGVVHRDVNPKNIFVTSAGVAKVIDFGIVKALGALNVTRTGSVKGTYSYMSPEQIKATGVDRRSDVFSLGTVTWEAITGVRLFKRENDFHTWRAITEDPIPPPSQFREGLPKAVDEVIGKALERDKTVRYATAREFGVALEHAIEERGGPLTPVAVASRIEQAFDDEFEKQRQRTYSPSTLEDDEPGGVGDFEVRVDEHGQATTVTPSAHREMFNRHDTEVSDSDVGESAMSGRSAPSTASDLHARSAPITGSDIHARGRQAPITGSDLHARQAPITGSDLHARQAPITGSDIHARDPLLESSPAVPLLESSPAVPLLESSPSIAPVTETSLEQAPAKKGHGVTIALVLAMALAAVGVGLYLTRSDPTPEKTAGTSEKRGGQADDERDSTGQPVTTPLTDPVEKEADAGATVATGPDDGAAAAAAERERREKEAAARVAEEKEKAEARAKELEEEKKKQEKEKREKEKKEKKEKKEREKKEREKKEKEERERLAALPPGTLNINAMPFGTVFINGKRKGQTPLMGISLKPGTYTVKIQSSAGTESRRVTIHSGKLSRVNVKF